MDCGAGDADTPEPENGYGVDATAAPDIGSSTNEERWKRAISRAVPCCVVLKVGLRLQTSYEWKRVCLIFCQWWRLLGRPFTSAADWVWTTRTD
jgi:hypothetical protein